MGRYFGTDGVRGVANEDLTPELALALGRAGAAVLGVHTPDPMKPIVVGRDTRLSGAMLEAALVAGITSAGRDVVLLGVLPTPGVAMITASIEAAGGVMISASHNPIEDNGIKFFGPDGFKLDDAQEAAIEERLEDPALARPTGLDVGLVRGGRGLLDNYFGKLVAAGADLRGWTVVVDAAFGAAYEIGPRLFARLGAHVDALHAEDDGSRINVACGTTNMAALVARTAALRAAGTERVVGVAFDGDADRVLLVDETGAILTGDHILLILATSRKQEGRLPGDAVVGTVMANLGLERALADAGIALHRAPVGDRYVLAQMRASGERIGGEQSGHVIDLDRNTTGDGVMTAATLLAIAERANRTLHELAQPLREYPQVLLNVRVRDKSLVAAPAIAQAIANAERTLAGDGRILVRASGTEPLIRVMMEGSDRTRITDLAEQIAASIRAVAGVSD